MSLSKILKKNRLKQSRSEFDYGVLPEAIMDACIDGLKGGRGTKVLKQWEFSQEFSVGDIIRTGGKAEVKVQTPQGEKVFKIKVTLG